ncbi:hypothetical protein NM688_g8252 [Phlebia brevispora]|uniref:Uncharacterized protein n=1 Tax=Phlebia brevispora TaxID=194682 RepID=A0ACC1RVC0_9APHY|nr:hypothetical protein NM688_g8252 [Phlebia brevispora]
MPQPISIPPLIPLPKDNQQSNGDAKDDIFATLFSPATPRPSPATSPPPGDSGRPKYGQRHSRTSSTDSEFGSFVSVPSQEDPLSQFVSASDSVPFTPLQNFEFFEGAKAAQDKNKQGVLDELLNHEADPLYFLRSATPKNPQPDFNVPTLVPLEPPEFDTTHDADSTASADTSGMLPEQPLIPIETNPLPLKPAQDKDNREVLDEALHVESDQLHLLRSGVFPFLLSAIFTEMSYPRASHAQEYTV